MVNEGKELVKSNGPLSEVFEKYQDEDGFLYILYTGEDVYGWILPSWGNVILK